MITVVNKRKGGMGEFVGRGSPLGNPYVLRDESERDRVCDQYQEWLDRHIIAGTPLIVNELMRLLDLARAGDLALVCFCAPKRCHGNTIKATLEELLAT